MTESDAVQAVSGAREIRTMRPETVRMPVRLRFLAKDGREAEDLILLRLFRLLPGKRLVALAKWQDRTVVAKLFFNAAARKRHVARELSGYDALEDAGIRTASLLCQGTLVETLEDTLEDALAGTRGRTGAEKVDAGAGEDWGSCLLFEFLDGSVSVESEWQRLASDPRTKSEALMLLRQVVRQIVLCHRKGLLQHDPHLENFLLRHGRLYLMDPGSVNRQNHSSIGKKAASEAFLDNLALFFAQFPVSNDAELPALYRDYVNYANYVDCVNDERPARTDIREGSFERFAARVRAARLRRVKVVLGKLFRSTSVHNCQQSWRHFAVYRRELQSPDLDDFIRDPDSYVRRGHIIKPGNSSTVAGITLGSQEYVVKRYNIKSIGHGLTRLLRPSRAWVSWRNAHLLQTLGIATPQPLLLLERRIGFLRREAYFVCDYVPGVDALQLLAEEPINSLRWQRALPQFWKLFQIMMRYHIVHGDMKGSNFICSGEQLLLVDLDAMHRVASRSRFRNRFKRDLHRFLRNWQGNESVSKMLGGLIGELISDPERNHPPQYKPTQPTDK